MKRALLCLIAAVLLISLVSVHAPRSVSATGISEGSWVLPEASASITYTSVNVEQADVNAPSWVRRFSDGIKISSPTKICYSFRRGAFHWVPKFMQLKNGNWSSVSSAIEYLNGIEGGTYACAQPTTAGTYALFAYYNGPQETTTQKTALPLCADVEISDKTIGNSGDSVTITHPIYFVSNIEFTRLEVISYLPTNFAFKDSKKWADITFDDDRESYVGVIYGLYVDEAYNTLEPEDVVVRLSNDNCYIEVGDFDYDS